MGLEGFDDAKRVSIAGVELLLAIFAFLLSFLDGLNVEECWVVLEMGILIDVGVRVG